MRQLLPIHRASKTDKGDGEERCLCCLQYLLPYPHRDRVSSHHLQIPFKLHSYPSLNLIFWLLMQIQLWKRGSLSSLNAGPGLSYFLQHIYIKKENVRPVIPESMLLQSLFNAKTWKLCGLKRIPEISMPNPPLINTALSKGRNQLEAGTELGKLTWSPCIPDCLWIWCLGDLCPPRNPWAFCCLPAHLPHLYPFC